MPKLYELTEPIQNKQFYDIYEDQLNNLQGNILSSHGRRHSIYLFLHFKDSDKSIKNIKEWIHNLAKEHITSAKRQYDEATEYRRYEISGSLFVNLLLSSKGYEILAIDTIDKLKNRFGHEAFLQGMQDAQHRLNDPQVHTWEEGYREHEIHALILLADNDEPYLLRKTREIVLEKIGADVKICAVERGRVMRNERQLTVEHFGYIDGRSQPLFFERDIEREQREQGGIGVWDPSAGPHLVLVADPYETDYSGSYAVFRKLEQNVRRFKEQEIELAKTLGLAGEDAARVGSLVIGRFEDGTPLALQPRPGSQIIPNNFTYAHDSNSQQALDNDLNGHYTPLQSHIRKMNPRDRQNRMRRIVRRGVTYGKREKEPKDNPRLEELPTEGVGLLFLCYQRNIETQFEFLQSKWANDPRHPRPHGAGIDPVMGQIGSLGTGQQRWPARWGEPREQHRAFDFHGFVTLKGGEYFFAPSIRFLQTIETFPK